jgi:hypothetical protein
MKTNGKDLMIRVDGQTIALATSCSFETTVNVTDGRTKRSKGPNDVPTGISWNLTSENLVGINPGAIQQTYASLMMHALRKERVAVEFIIVEPSSDGIRGDWLPGDEAIAVSNGFQAFTGEALITGVTLNAPIKAHASMTVKLNGQGELIPYIYE